MAQSRIAVKDVIRVNGTLADNFNIYFAAVRFTRVSKADSGWRPGDGLANGLESVDVATYT